MNDINPNSDQQSEKKTHLFRRSLMQLIILSILGMGLWINGCDYSNAGSVNTLKSGKENNMETLESSSTIKPRIPPIDAALPAEIKTATFALG